MPSYTEARDEMYDKIYTPWSLNYPDYPLFFRDVKHTVPTANDTDGNPVTWARMTINHSEGRNDAIGRRLFERRGTLTVQIFSAQGSGSTILDNVAKLVTDNLQGEATQSGVWFRNVRLNEVGFDGPWFNVNVLADFEYCEEL